MKKTISLTGMIFFLLVLTQLISCKKEEEQPDVIASFTSQVDAVDFKKVTFTNQSQNFSALSWNFGDNTAESTEANPVHTYVDLGDFVVTLTATSLDGKVIDEFTATISIADPNAELTKLVGDVSKTWKLLRDGSTGRWPLLVFPYNAADPNTPTTIWWAMGLNNDELANRPCMLNDEFTFYRDGTLEINMNGDYWAEGGIFTPDNKCASTSEPMTSVNGEDLSAWAGGTHTFELIIGADPKLKAIGTGAFIGFEKAATEYEVMKLDPFVQDMVQYNLVKLTDGTTDTLIIQCNYFFEIGDPVPGGSWRFTLVHYDNPNDEPPIPTNNPSPNFTFVLDGLNATFTNTSQFCDTYSWDFGDGATSTETSPTHTYSTEGIFNVVLTGTNANGTATTSQEIWVSSTVLTDAMIQGGPWKIRVAEKTVFCGGGLGLSNWWAVPLADLQEGGAWSCMTDDEFTFSAGGVYTYDGKGLVRNDGYLSTEPNGCIEESALSGNGLFFASGSHTYTFTPAGGGARPIIELTNGADRAAFIGFYKGYYGGENSVAPGEGQPLPNGGNPTNRYEVMGYVNNGSVEYLFVTVDITADHSGTASWSAILER
jgi:PKD repeat protein